MAILTYHPFKAAYALAAIGFELARLPIYLVKYLTSYGRQHPDWTFRQALVVRMWSSLIYHMSTVQMPTPLPLTPGNEKERWVTFKPAKNEYYKGALRSNPDVKPVEIGGTWYPAPLTRSSDKSNIRVILHIHGGAFVIDNGRDAGSGPVAKYLLRHATATHVFCPQYRLSTLPVSKTSDAFPAAIQDSLTTYLYFLNDLNISPKNIVFSGDSAGGNAVIALLRYIEEYGSELGIPNPAAALLWSPWIDPSDTSNSYTRDNVNYRTDFLSPPLTQWGAKAYAGLPGLEALKTPYVNAKLKPFKAKLPLWVMTGGAEVLYFDNVEWYEKAKEAGNDVTLHIEPHVPHDILLVADPMGFSKEAANSAKQAGEWLRSKI